MKTIVVDKLGWPVEHFAGHPILNFLRDLIHCRKTVCAECYERSTLRSHIEQQCGARTNRSASA